MLWGTGDEELRTAVVAAHERAVASTLDFLQDHAAFTRRGDRGIVRRKDLVGGRLVADRPYRRDALRWLCRIADYAESER